ncbi:MAG: lysophospholipase [Alphaproteobacteria bacterium]|nr:lysophospholipase [Alphaproteobacteria bacterium]
MSARTVLPILLAVLLAACAPRIQAPGPNAENPMPPKLTEEHYVTRDGTRLPLRLWSPDTTPRAVVLALHGFNDYSEAFATFGPWMADNGVAVVAYDQRGFGQAPQTGMWPGHDILADDARGAVAAIAEAYPGLPRFALGESMGGAVLMSAWDVGPLDVDGLVLVAPAVWGRETMPGYQTASLWLFAHTMPWLALSPKGIKRHPSDNIEMLRALNRDPLVIKNTRIDAMWGIVNLMDDALATSTRFDAPALMLFGANDDIVPPEAARRTIDALPETDDPRHRVAVYEDGYHMLLRDLQGETVWQDILAWMRSPDAPLPSGADAGDVRERLPAG